MYALGVKCCAPEVIAYPCVVVAPEAAIEVVDENPVDDCIGFTCPVGKNMLELVDVNPTVGIRGSGNSAAGVDDVMFGIAMGAEIEAVDAGADPIDAIAMGLVLAIVDT